MDNYYVRRSNGEQGLSPDYLPRALRALVLLSRPCQAALSERAGLVSYAAKDGALRKAGVMQGDLDWLLNARYVVAADDEGANAGSASLIFEGVLYQITSAGTQFLEQISDALAPNAADDLRRNAAGKPIVMPRWDAERRELTYRGILIKRFRKVAPNQECILDAFELQRWPRRISDPLPLDITVMPTDRRHYAIKRLNQTLEVPLLHFGGDGKGAGICWRSIGSPLEDES